MKIALVIIGCCIAVGIASARAPASPSVPVAAAGFYIVRPDPRECPSPLCGGYWVSLANHARTKCGDGLLRPRCYVASAVDSRTDDETQVPGNGVAKGTLGSKQTSDFGELGVLSVSSTWAPVSSASATGRFFRLRDTGIRCVRAPCLSFRAQLLNSTLAAYRISEVKYGPARSGSARRRAETALASTEGLLASGTIVDAVDGARVFRMSQVYLKPQTPHA